MEKKKLEFNKEIYLLRLAITTKCILRCKYCFVDKTNKVMPYETALNAINFFLRSPGNQKILIIYGGEPLLFFDLVKEIIIYSYKKAKKLKKQLIISLGTNGLLLTQSQLKFFMDTNTKLSISLDGQKSFHNKMRVFPNGKGSFDMVHKKIPLILENIKKENFSVLFGLLPSSVSKMYDNLIYLINLGFDSINIEPIQSTKLKWNHNQKEVFKKNMARFIRYVYENIVRKKFIFLNNINRELKNKRLTAKRNTCPFFENLEVYPGGEMAFSPFLINSKERNKYIIGNINYDLKEKYRFCKFSFKEEKCKNCWNNYTNGGIFDFGQSDDIYKIRDIYSIDLAKKIRDCSRQMPIFKKYIKEAKKRIFE